MSKEMARNGCKTAICQSTNVRYDCACLTSIEQMNNSQQRSLSVTRSTYILYLEQELLRLPALDRNCHVCCDDSASYRFYGQGICMSGTVGYSMFTLYDTHYIIFPQILWRPVAEGILLCKRENFYTRGYVCRGKICFKLLWQVYGVRLIH